MERIKKTAVVTGASSGIGRAIAFKLCEMDYEVYGIGRHFEEMDYPFHTVTMDLRDTAGVLEWLKETDLSSLSVLVNNAGSAYYGMHEEISPAMIFEMTETDLEVPMLLCGQLIRTLRKTKGTIINIASAAALTTSTHATVYGACKAGLIHFSKALLQENRKHGVKVTVIIPDMTDTNLYRNADFQASREEGCSLLPQDIADAVENILNMRDGVIVETVSLKPQFHRIVRK